MKKMISFRGRAWIVATSIGAVEALKDQGFCRWNYAIKLLQQHANTQIRTYSLQAKTLSGSSSTFITKHIKDDKFKESEDSLRKVMYLSCWGPN